MKLLIIEDEIALAAVLKEKFEKHGFTVKTVEDGGSAFKAVKSYQPDMVLLDLILPKKGGFEVLEELKQDAEVKHIPVIILSNLSDDENIKKGLRLGAIDYFAKAEHPLHEIIEKVKEAMVKKGK